MRVTLVANTLSPLHLGRKFHGDQKTEEFVAGLLLPLTHVIYICKLMPVCRLHSQRCYAQCYPTVNLCRTFPLVVIKIDFGKTEPLCCY